MSLLHLDELNSTNVAQAHALALAPKQEYFSTPASYTSLAHTLSPSATWNRVIFQDDTLVGYMICGFEDNPSQTELRSILWKLIIAKPHQRNGIGRFAVRAFAQEARNREQTQIHVFWEPGDEGPESFFLNIGFTPIGETSFGETIGVLAL